MLKNPFLKSLLISYEILSKFGVRGTRVSKGNIQGIREQWGLSGLISVIRPGLEAWPLMG